MREPVCLPPVRQLDGHEGAMGALTRRRGIARLKPARSARCYHRAAVGVTPPIGRAGLVAIATPGCCLPTIAAMGPEHDRAAARKSDAGSYIDGVDRTLWRSRMATIALGPGASEAGSGQMRGFKPCGSVDRAIDATGDRRRRSPTRSPPGRSDRSPVARTVTPSSPRIPDEMARLVRDVRAMRCRRAASTSAQTLRAAHHVYVVPSGRVTAR